MTSAVSDAPKPRVADVTVALATESFDGICFQPPDAVYTIPS